MSTSSDVYSEEPYALIGHVRFCEGEVRAQNGAHPLYSTKAFEPANDTELCCLRRSGMAVSAVRARIWLRASGPIRDVLFRLGPDGIILELQPSDLNGFRQEP